MSDGHVLAGAPTRVLAIGLDGADRRLLLRWTEDDTMPCLATLRREGAWCAIATPPGLGDDAVWGSFSTGVSPARHSRYFYDVVIPGTYDTHYRDASWLKREPFWSSLGRRGLRVAVLDAPKCTLAHEASVVQIADWRCHGRSGLPAANPPELAGELIERFGDDATDVYEGANERCSGYALPASEIASFLAELEQSVERKREASEWLLAQGGWDLFLSVFKEAHCAGHQCWDERDATQPALRRIYRRLDAALDSHLRRVGRETPVLVFSCLGMGANHSGSHLLDALLTALEPLVMPPRLASRRGRARRRGSEAAGGRVTVDRATRVVYPIEHNECSGAIRVNVVDREPCGLVRRGAELDRLCTRLSDELLALTEPADGRPIVEQVIRCDREYAGEHVEALPDLLVVWRRDAPIRRAMSPTVGEIRAPEAPLRPGNHLDGGILFARMPGLPCGIELASASIVDLAPTLAALTGVGLDGVDGRPISLVSRYAGDGDRGRP